MFGWVCYDRMEEMDAVLYGGPVTVEHIFERDAGFHTFHPGRRPGEADLAPRKSSNEECKTRYHIYRDTETRKIVCELITRCDQ